MIQPALQSERPPADRFRRHIGDQRVTGWSPQPFAEAIDDAQADDLPRRRGGRDDGPYGGRDEVADDDQRPAAGWPVGETAGDELYERGGGIGGAVERAQRHGPAAQ